MTRRIPRDIVPTAAAKVKAERLEALRDAGADDEFGAGATDPAVKVGVSDAAARHDALAGLADRLPTTGGATDGAGDGKGVGVAGLDSFAAPAPTGVDAAIGEAQAALRDRLAGASLTDGGPKQVAPEDAIADAKAGLPGSNLRESSNDLLFEEAANDTQPQGIADQGTGAVSSDISTKEGRIEFMKKLLGGKGDLGPVRDTDEGVKGTGAKVDLSETGTGLLQRAKLVQSNLDKGDAFTAEVVKITPEGTVISETNAGVRIAEMTSGKTVRTEPDGTKTVIEPDGSSTTVHPNKDVTETPPTKPGVSIPDPEGGDDRFRFVSEGLKDRLGPKGVDGDGDIDFGDDIPFGVGVGAQLADTKGTLLGDAGRAGGVDDGPATSGFAGFDLVRNSGAVDFEDESPLGGGLEDDPLAGNRIAPNLGGGLAVTDEEDDEDDAQDDEAAP
jgi:hypothetical protein